MDTILVLARFWVFLCSLFLLYVMTKEIKNARLLLSLDKPDEQLELPVYLKFTIASNLMLMAAVLTLGIGMVLSVSIGENNILIAIAMLIFGGFVAAGAWAKSEQSRAIMMK